MEWEGKEGEEREGGGNRRQIWCKKLSEEYDMK